MMSRVLTVSVVSLCLSILGAYGASPTPAEVGVKGGFVVCVGCDDAAALSGLRASDSYLVEGLDTDPGVVAVARTSARAKGLYGKVSVQQFDGRALPYVGDLVNLIVLNNPCSIDKAEIERVLAPRGVLAVRKGAAFAGLDCEAKGDWLIWRKPVPDSIDDWTHYLHDSRGTSVSGDTVAGHPKGLKWTGGPFWARSHEHTAGMNAMVSASGRVFYVMDEGPTDSIQLPSNNILTARDAFSGVVLWKHPLRDWWNSLYPVKSGPGWLPRRLVAVGDRVYVAPGVGQDLICLDAATGKLVRTYEGTAGTFELLVSEGVVLAVVDPNNTVCDYQQESANCWKERARASKKWQWTPETGARIIKALAADTGKILWSRETPVAPMSLAVDSKIACYYDGKALAGLNRQTGEELWSTVVPGPKAIQTGYSGPRVVMCGERIVFAPMGRMVAVSAATGEVLWSVDKKPRSGHYSLEDFYVLGETIWVLQKANKGGFSTYSLVTGSKLTDYVNPINSFYIHQRCYPGRATVKYQLPPMMGIQVYDMETDTWQNNHWVRGGCIYGIMPANGMVYAPPHACACYYQSKLNGFNAIAPEPEASEAPPAAERLMKGPAYGRTGKGEYPASAWPVFRHDNARTGYVATAVSAGAKEAWRRGFGTKLSQTTVADGTVFVSAVDRHTVYALDATSGREIWSFVAGGRVDSPPTIHKGLAVFGCADGFVYAVTASTGELVWRFQGAPSERKMIAYGQPESVWPISGSVLIQDGKLYCVAGRSMFLDGGLRMLTLSPLTGELLSENVMDHRVPGEDKELPDLLMGKHMPVAMPDILSSDGTYVYMKSQTFTMDGKRLRVKPQRPDTQYDREIHLFSPISFLDDGWHQRTYWIYGRAAGEGWAEFQYPPKRVPCGRIMCIDEANAYSYGRDPELVCNTSVSEYRLFSAAKLPTRKIGHPRLEGKWEKGEYIPEKGKGLAANSVDWHQMAKKPADKLSALDYHWLHEEPDVMAKAMVCANDHLFVAGPRDVADEKKLWGRSNSDEFRKAMSLQAEWLQGKRGGVLQVYSKKDGKKLAEQPLDILPAFDGLVAADGCLYMTTTCGTIVCLAGK